MPITKQQQDIVASVPRYPQEVVDFCEKSDLLEKLDVAVELVKETFPEAERMSVEVEQDPESQHTWVLVNALVRGKATDVLVRHGECVRRLLKVLKWPASTLIRTTYTLA